MFGANQLSSWKVHAYSGCSGSKNIGGTKSPILIFCRQFSNIEAKQNASKNLDNSTNMCDIKLDEGFIVCYDNN